MRGENNRPETTVNTVNETNQLSVKPPNYSDLFDRSNSSSAKSSPPRYSSKTPSVEISSSNEKIAEKAEKPTEQEKPKKQKIIKPKKQKKQTEQTEEQKKQTEEQKKTEEEGKK